jgi:hypothetical protein
MIVALLLPSFAPDFANSVEVFISVVTFCFGIAMPPDFCTATLT